MIGILAAAAIASTPSQTELTIYNQGFGLVKEVRRLNLKSGRQKIAIEDVPSLIEPTSVGIHSLSSKPAFSILEQNYEYDLINSQAILAKAVGQKIRFIRTIGNKKEVLTGTLLSSPTSVVKGANGESAEVYNGMVIRTDDGRIVLDPVGEVEVTSIPPGLISRPTLIWDIDSNKSGEDSVEMSYVSQGLTWSAAYVLTLDGTGKADMQGWVTLSNTSGATWKDASLKLLAGDVNVASDGAPVGVQNQGFIPATKAPSNGFQEESLFEYHLYTLQRPATIRNNETKQLSLLEGHGIPVRKRLIIDSISDSYYPNEGEVGTGDIKPEVRLEFVNDKKSGLGMPLPKGSVKIYQRDSSGSVQLLGEDSIDHTPRNEEMTLNVGKSFDVVATRKRLAYRRIRLHNTREVFEIEVRNRKEAPETVDIFERHYGDWKITEKSQPFTKPIAEMAKFIVNLQPNEVKKVRYTVETRW